MRSLRITAGPAAGRSIEIENELVIGRENADVTIEDPELSRRHVALRPVERGVEIEDLGSLNGTFVNGQRISSPVTLSASGTLRVGDSQGAVHVTLPQTTRSAEVSDAVFPAPESTVARAVPEARDVTAAKPPTAPEPTVKRPVGAAGPPVVAPPSRPRPPPEEEGARSGLRRAPLIGAVVAILVLVVVAVIASGGGEGAEKRTVSMKLDLGTATAEDKRLSESRPGRKAISWNLYGRAHGRPFGTGNVNAVATLQPGGPPKGKSAGSRPPRGKPKPATVTARRVLRFPRGTLVATERIQSVNRGDRLEFKGTGRILSGTGDFEDANGTYRVTGARPSFTESAQTIEWAGSVEY